MQRDPVVFSSLSSAAANAATIGDGNTPHGALPLHPLAPHLGGAKRRTPEMVEAYLSLLLKASPPYMYAPLLPTLLAEEIRIDAYDGAPPSASATLPVPSYVATPSD